MSALLELNMVNGLPVGLLLRTRFEQTPAEGFSSGQVQVVPVDRRNRGTALALDPLRDLGRLDRLVIPIEDAFACSIQDQVVVLVGLEERHLVEAELSAGSHADFDALLAHAIQDRRTH